MVMQDMATNTTESKIAITLDDLMRCEAMSVQFSLPPLVKSGSTLAGRHGSRFRGRGLNFEEFRSYQFGDDVRNIDWSVSLRTGELNVRVYSEEKDRSIYLIVDQRSTMFFASVDTMKSVVVADIAAACAWRGIKNGDRVGAILLGDQSVEFYKPQRTRDQVMRILGRMAEMNQALQGLINRKPVESPYHLDDALLRLLQTQPKGALIVILSDFRTVAPSTNNYVQWLKRHNDILGVSVKDPMEVDLNVVDQLYMSDGELQATLTSEHRYALHQYNQQSADCAAHINRLISADGIPMVDLDTSGQHKLHFLQQMTGRVNVK